MKHKKIDLTEAEISQIIGDCADYAEFQRRCDQIKHGKRPGPVEGAGKKCTGCG